MATRAAALAELTAAEMPSRIRAARAPIMASEGGGARARLELARRGASIGTLGVQHVHDNHPFFFLTDGRDCPIDAPSDEFCV
jgi:hypothetical protein